MIRRLAFLLALAAVPTAARAENTYVMTPGSPWSRVLPYVRANIVPVLDGNEFSVYVCEDQTDRSVVDPFNDQLGDFAKVLVMESVIEDDAVERGIRKITDDFKKRAPSWSAAERERYRQAFWDAIVASPSILARMRLRYERAQHEGTLRCQPCEHKEDFAPRAMRVARAR